jgi:MFS family permease
MQKPNINLMNNLRQYNLATFFRTAADMMRGFLFLFYASVGLNLAQCGILTAILAATMLVFDIPSGILADKMGRKKILVLSAIFALISTIILIFFSSFWFLAIAAFFFGLEIAFKSGAGSALIYDTCRALKKEALFKPFKSKNFSINMYTISVFSIIAGFIAEVSFKFIFIISFIFLILYLFTLFTLIEPAIKNKTHKEVWSHFSESVKEIFSSRKILFIFIYSLLVVGVVEGFYKYHQIYATNVGFSVHLVGILFGVMFLFAGLGSFFAHRIESKLGYSWLIFLQPFGLGLVYLLMGWMYTFLAAGLLLIESIIVGVYQPVIADLQNKYISSDRRATILSISSVTQTIIMMLISLIIGFLSLSFGLNNIYICLGAVMMIGGIIISYELLRSM